MNWQARMNWQTRTVSRVIEQRRRVYWTLLALVLLALVMFPRLKVDTDPENMLPHSNPARMMHDEIKQQFSLYDVIVIGIVNHQAPQGIYNPNTLAKLYALAKAVEAIDGVITSDLMSLVHADNITQEGPGTIRFEWMMPNAPTNDAESQAIAASVARLPLLQNTLVSGDGRAAGIYVPIVAKDQSYRIAEQIKKLIEPLQNGEEDFHIAGLPVAEDTFGVEMFKQMAISAPLAGLVIFLLMYGFFRSFSLISAPMIVAMATVIITMGTLIGAGFTVHIMSSMIPIFLMPIAVVDSVHLLSEFTDRYRPGMNKAELATEVVCHLFQPMLFTSITSAVGFASMLFTPIPPVQVFGAFVALGIVLAFVLTIVFIPAYMSGLSDKHLEAMSATLHKGEETRSALARGLRKLGPFSVRNAKTVVMMSLLVVGVSVWGLQKIVVNDNPTNWFQKEHPIRVADKVMNEHFAGTYDAFIRLSVRQTQDPWPALGDKSDALMTGSPVSVQRAWQAMLQERQSGNYEEGIADLALELSDRQFDAKDDELATWENLSALIEAEQQNSKRFLQPQLLQQIVSLEQSLLESGYVGKVNALPDAVRTVYRELKGGDSQYYLIPESANAVAQTLLTYQGSHRPGDLWHMVTPDYRSTVLWLQLKSGDNRDMTKVEQWVNNYLATQALPADIRMDWGGLTYINVVWQDAMVKGMFSSLMSSFVVVLIMMIVLFRSVLWGVLAMLPLSITITFIYGVIGIIGKNYDMPVAVLSALTLGMSVDFAIHFIERTRSVFKATGSWHKTLQDMFEEPARAISRNAIVIALGFTPLLFAPLVPYQTVGVFLATIMTVSCLVTLMLLPAMLQLLRGWLFESSQQKSASE